MTKTAAAASRRFFLQSGALAAGALAFSASAPGVEAAPAIQRPFGARMKLSLAGYSYRKYMSGKNPTMTIMDFLDECAKLGLGASEPTSYYFPSALTTEFLLQFKRKAHLLGLDISGTAVGNTLTHPPGPEREKQIQMVKDWIDYSAIFGAPCIRIFAGSVSENAGKEQAIRWAVEATQQACEYAAQKGVFLALENHGGIVSEPDDMLRIIDGVQSEWFGVNFDSGNFHTEDPYQSLEKIAPYAVNAQIKVEMRPQGKDREPADYDRLIGILGEAGYRGYTALEYEGSEEPKEAVPRHLEAMQKAIDKAGF
ncbi:MAG: sugar phosphate isomerase/epimerase [Candidatus Omnitrophica bacterium]|nr:sugar phosphate isomerase/epimerase [Candidatus Omnitrophota bacterium]